MIVTRPNFTVKRDTVGTDAKQIKSQSNASLNYEVTLIATGTIYIAQTKAKATKTDGYPVTDRFAFENYTGEVWAYADTATDIATIEL